MFLYEVGLPNGFTIDMQKEKTRNSAAKKVEFEKGSANLYFNEVELL